MRAQLLSASVILVCLTGCGGLWGPTATTKNFISAAERGDVDTMTALFSAGAIQRLGVDRIRGNNQQFSLTAKRAIAAGKNLKMEDVKETVAGDSAVVSFFYRDAKGSDSMRLVFSLVKENGSWKINDIGGPEELKLLREEKEEREEKERNEERKP